jgi:carboxypeptidase Q
MKKLLLVFILFSFFRSGHAQSDSAVIRSLFNAALTNHESYEQLRYLCKNIGGRICGSPEAAAAVEWAAQTLNAFGADTVWKQEMMVRNWKRGEAEYAFANSRVMGKAELTVCALGGSVGTGKQGVMAEVLMVKSMDELRKMPPSKVKGKIVFFNRAADPTNIYTFASYGGAADQRVNGAIEAARMGGIAALVRSVTLQNHDYAHTGVMRYDTAVTAVPALAISPADAGMLEEWLQIDPLLKVFLRNNSVELPEVPSHNVIAEIRGSRSPDTVIVIGAHLDAWDNGEGAHDDGVGVVQVMEVLRLFKSLNIKLNFTLRVVEFMDEEVAQRGAAKYAEYAANSGEFHLAAIETDRGGFSPRGFSFDAGEKVSAALEKWKPLLDDYGLHLFYRGGSGVDIAPLKKLGVPLLALVPDSQRYFDYQHAPTDRFEAVSQREMQLGAASIAAMVFLIDKYGW